MFTLAQARSWIEGAKLVGDADHQVYRICTDSRLAKSGDLFVPLVGERFDAHAFIGQVIGAGVRAVLSAQSLSPDALIDGQIQRGVMHGLQVPDTTIALQQLAAGWRRQFSLPVIAVTGSNGKTTVKEMIASILRVSFGDAALASQGNLNNGYGVPMSVLRLRATHRAAVFELGINQVGEMAQLCPIAQPTLTLVNNAQREHQEFLHGVEASARENGAAISQLQADGIAVFPGDDQCAPIWQSLAGNRRCVCFGWHDHWPVHATALTANSFRLHSHGRDGMVRLRIVGRHNIRNAMAAAACCQAIGISFESIVTGLEQFEPVGGRLRQIPLHAQALLIDDSYNANPDSVRAAIDVLAGMAGERFLVLGDMGEVGEQGDVFHEEVGVYARTCGIDQLWLLGDATRDSAKGFGEKARHFGDDVQALIEALAAVLDPDHRPRKATVLVKGSRFMAMERVVKALTEDQHVKVAL
ncbi:MAG: UDP-N-acetylmuramoyl-tripeptide--D-alanyl-D-alanine ligase [Betaproteobacteria bacterium]|jgi:UDP-N-acetylmuramoyl-tripeptide--D-alanyl-D-alanine ligase|nr:UDP-N-acetylmuramoyl-tripeptide--D-alanyl-D-alanine ligase [Pseudomonadota bacterium]NBO04258.1 UDP-N-acetylmuramoyl-tripeptide--D-alanyl-D-alanine ligase [Betaproteobacteria bacterium]NBO96227.1 UDP-N-acetylmuramoyl-tripeptide--D-alanyl-D-alanine ligase [Betaproteobacteria bacterium]NBP34732.1 UDP-N-acetylmuramoyl-tripeptide--D-alanyl-D-alanine ligase [Betaproteobacteria bacterium]NBP37667.1 UDP-N-acetylmuramoyl-tripeptide--D-alanyl-D-alanine ligase [Betaproteobacteria bacterium]